MHLLELKCILEKYITDIQMMIIIIVEREI